MEIFPLLFGKNSVCIAGKGGGINKTSTAAFRNEAVLGYQSLSVSSIIKLNINLPAVHVANKATLSV
jgi:hypothetical protein